MKQWLTWTTLFSIIAFGIGFFRSQPVGACSIFCPGDDHDLFDVEVTLVSGNESATAPEWPNTALLRVDSWDGRPNEIRLSDEDALYLLREVQ